MRNIAHFKLPRQRVLQIVPIAIVLLLVTLIPLGIQLFTMLVKPNLYGVYDFRPTRLEFCALILMASWLWLQWPRPIGSYVICAISILLMTLKLSSQFSHWLFTGNSDVFDVLHQWSCVFCSASITAILFRVVSNRRWVDTRLPIAEADASARTSLADLLAIVTCSALLLGVFRHPRYQFAFEDLFSTGGPQWLLFGAILTGTMGSCVVIGLQQLFSSLTGKKLVIVALISIPMLVVLFSGTLNLEAFRDEIYYRSKYSNVLTCLQECYIDGLLTAIALQGFVLLATSCGIALRSPLQEHQEAQQSE